MPPISHPLTPEVARQIVAAIRAGAFPHIAAEAAGIPRNVFQGWLRQGERKGGREPFKSFAKEVRTATAQARLRAEMEVFQGDPKSWLRSGPGKESPQTPGWTGIVKPGITNDLRQINIFNAPDFLEFLKQLRQILAPYPDALQAISQALEKPTIKKLKPPED